MTDRKQHNSTLRPISLKRQAQMDAGTYRAKERKPLKKVSLKALEKQGLVRRASTLPPSRKRIKPRRKLRPGEKTQPQVFSEIWKSRPHECQVCRAPIDEPTLSNFSHILSKGAYPSMKLDERNIEIWCEDCHYLYTIKDVSVASRPMWRRVHEKAGVLAKEANNVNQ